MRKLVAGTALLMLVGCSSSAKEDVGRNSAAIQGGTTDTSHSFAVGIFTGGGLCSGALIAPNLVLTARHCVAEVGSEAVNCATDRFGKNNLASDMYVTTDARMSQQGHYYQAAKIVTPTDTKFCGNDMALIILAKNVPASEATPITPAVEHPITDHTTYGTEVTAIGYGITSVGAQDEGVRRIKQNIPITCIPGDAKLSCGDTYGQLADSEFMTDAGTCSGDSGSSAYEEKSFDSGQPVTLGVLSRGGESGTKCLDAVYTRTDSFKDLIIQTAYEAAKTGGYNPPAWTNPPPAPDGTPQAGALGATCDKDDDCLSKICATADGNAYTCSQACTPGDDTTCPDGYSCLADGDNGYCLVKPPEAAKPAAQPTQTSSGCSVATHGGPTNPVPWIFGVALGIAATLTRRRKK